MSTTGRLVPYQYFEALIDGRRVLELGGGGASPTEWLAARASEVTAQDLCLELPGLPLEDGLAQVILIPELEQWAGWAPLVRELDRVLAADGVLLASVGCGELTEGSGLTYQDLTDLLVPAFEHVRVLGMIPFSGFTVADFDPGDDDLEPALDCSLVEEDQPPRRYLAMASPREISAQPYEVVQVPGAPDGVGVAPLRVEEVQAEASSQRTRAETERIRAQAAERALGEVQASARQQARRADTAERRADSLMARLEAGAEELAGLHKRLADVQAEGQANRWRVDELSGLCQQLQQELDEKKPSGGNAGDPGATKLEETRRALKEAEARVAEQSRRATNAQARLAALEEQARKASAAPAEPEPTPAPEPEEPAGPDLRRQVDEATQSLEEKSVELVEARADNRRLRQENAKLARKLAAALSELQKLKQGTRNGERGTENGE